MTIIAACSLLAGAVLGLRLKVLVLVPAIGVALIAAAALGIVGGHGLGWVMLASVIAAGALQLGYLCGVLTRLTMGASRMRAATHPSSAANSVR